MSPTTRKRLSLVWAWLRWPAALALLAYLFYANVWENEDRLRSILAEGVNWWAVLAALVTCLGALLLTFYRWYLLVWAQDFPFTHRDALRLGMLGYALIYVGPGTMGSDLVKAAMIARRQRSRRFVAAATVLLDRVLGVYALVAVAGLFYTLSGPEMRSGVLRALGTTCQVLTLAGIVGLVLVLNPYVALARRLAPLTKLPVAGPVLQELLNALTLYQSKWRVIVATVAVSVAGHVAMLSSFYFCSQSLDLGGTVPSFAQQLFVVPAAEVGAAVVPLPGGVGALEGGMAYFFAATDSAETRNAELASPPPDWQPALQQFVGDRKAVSAVLEEQHGLEDAAGTAATMGDVARGSGDRGTELFSGGVSGIPPEAVRDAYRRGHRELAWTAGLLTAFVYRIVSVFVAALGGVYFFTSREELQAVMEEEEAHEAAGGEGAGSQPASAAVGQRSLVASFG